MTDEPKQTPNDNQGDGAKDAALPEQPRKKDTPNPPWTTTGKITSPKFGSAGSGGAEYEPGLDKD